MAKDVPTGLHCLLYIQKISVHEINAVRVVNLSVKRHQIVAAHAALRNQDRRMVMIACGDDPIEAAKRAHMGDCIIENYIVLSNKRYSAVFTWKPLCLQAA